MPPILIYYRASAIPLRQRALQEKPTWEQLQATPKAQLWLNCHELLFLLFILRLWYENNKIEKPVMRLLHIPYPTLIHTFQYQFLVYSQLSPFCPSIAFNVSLSVQSLIPVVSLVFHSAKAETSAFSFARLKSLSTAEHQHKS